MSEVGVRGRWHLQAAKTATFCSFGVRPHSAGPTCARLRSDPTPPIRLVLVWGQTPLRRSDLKSVMPAGSKLGRHASPGVSAHHGIPVGVSTTGPPLEMPTFSRTLKYAKRAMRFRCPNCGVGKVRRGWGSVHERCSNCNYRFARSGAGDLTRAMFCNFPIAGFLFALCCNGGRGDVASCALRRGDVYRCGRRGARANAVVSVFAKDVVDG